MMNTPARRTATLALLLFAALPVLAHEAVSPHRPIAVTSTDAAGSPARVSRRSVRLRSHACSASGVRGALLSADVRLSRTSSAFRIFPAV